jgi:hypothetical protein
VDTVLTRRAHRAVAVLLAVVLAACGQPAKAAIHPFGAAEARLGEPASVLGWTLSVSDLRFESGYVLVDVDASPASPAGPRAKPEDLRFGLYGGLGHPIEATGVGSCGRVSGTDIAPLSAPSPDKIAGTVCVGPFSDQSQVRGIYVYSPRDRIAGTAAAYPAAFPVGLPPTNINDTGVTVSTTSAEAWRADGAQLTPAALGDTAAFSGNGYMLLGLEVGAIAEEYRELTAGQGGPMMVLVAPTLPPPGLNEACTLYGGSVLVLPDASLDAVQVRPSLCTQGEINAAVLYATVSVVGTHAAVWTRADRT